MYWRLLPGQLCRICWAGRLETPGRVAAAATASGPSYATQAATKMSPIDSSSSSKERLPRLPVPPLNDTLAKYLRTVKPLLSENDFQKTTEVVKRFGTDQSLGPKLQAMLENRANSMDNWLAEWWLNTAYLEYRQPVPVFSSPGLVFPLQSFKTQEDQLSYAAKMIHGALSFKKLIDEGQLKQDTMGGQPLDMSQYKRIFGTTRMPGPGRDQLSFHPNSKHIVVAYKNYFYKVDGYKSSGQIYSPQEIYAQLLSVLEQTQGLSGIPFGLLTSEHRDTWANAHARLCRDPVNLQSLKSIEESLFILSIDRPNRAFSLPAISLSSPREIEDTQFSEKQTIAARQMMHGNKTNSGNRWFDKTIGFIVGTDGEVGLVYEHSPSEGPPLSSMMDYIVNFIDSNPGPLELAKGAAKPKLLEFNLKDKKLSNAIAEAKDNLDALVSDINMSCFTFKKYGRDYIKGCKLSPDSYIQMAIQASFYRLHGCPGAQYESASTRMFAGGRTETIRSCSVESLDFSKVVLDTSMSLQDKFKYMKKAIDSHKAYAADAVKGLGVDRHLLGLKKIAVEKGMNVPDLFTDEGYIQSSTFKLSTSQVPSLYEAFMCYGPLVPDGYGCCYNPLANAIVFGISGFRSSPDTNAQEFKLALQATLLEMEKIGSMSTMQSKL